MRNRRSILVLVASTLLLVALAACSGGDDESGPEHSATSNSETAATPTPENIRTGGGTPLENTPADPTDDQPPQGIAVGEPTPGFSPVTLPERQLVFHVTTPANTPENAPLYLSIVDVTGGTDRHIRMKNLGDGVYETQAQVQSGALVRYTYDRFDGEGCCAAHVTREAIGELFTMQYRFLLIEPDMDRVNDSIATWADLRAPHPEGTITGKVVFAGDNSPVLDADVSISGIHVGTRVDGTFKVDGLPPGEHTIVVHSDSGDLLATQQTVTLDPGGTANTDFKVQKTKLVPVTFEALLPETTPDDAWVKIAGSIRSLGARIAHPARPLTPANFSLPLLERNGDSAHGEFMLPEGSHIEYFYTIGPIGVASETAEQGRWVFRSFIVGEGGDQRSDRVQNWANESWPLVTLKMTPPPGTPEGTKITITMGPGSWMEPRGDGTYTTVLGTYPPGGVISYQYVLGDSSAGLDGSDEAVDGMRTLVVPEKSGVVRDTITRWVGQRDSNTRREDGSRSVKFRVSVPPETPPDAEIYLKGNRPAIGDGVKMTPMPTNPWMYEADVVFGHDGPLAYSFELRSEGLESFARDVDTDYDGQVVNDWVASWPGLSPSVAAVDDFAKGYYTPDFFSNGFVDLSESTYSRIAEQGGSMVVVSSVWSYGQSQPIPTLEFRSVIGGSVATPIEDAIEQSRIAHEAGLDVFFGPQFNMEQAIGGFEVYNGPKSDEWWTEWLKLADEMWTWQATVAELIGAEYMMLPGPLFHVYDHIDKPADDPFIVNFDAEHVRLIKKVRSIYSGEIVISGGNKNYSFPGLADTNGVTTYDLGVPTLPATTTVAEFVDYYEERFADRVDSITEKWGNPVFFYTIHAPAVPTADDPSGEIAQAAALEALFQVIATRPEIVGALSWAYEMIDAPLHPTDGVRGRLGEAVLAKWYAILGGSS